LLNCRPEQALAILRVVPAPKPLEKASLLSPYEAFCQKRRKTPHYPALVFLYASVPARIEKKQRDFNASRVFRLLAL
jgi:hypothetical protein